MEKKYDYVIVGAGIAGLLTGALLSSDNNSVAVVDKNQNCGGYVHNLAVKVPYGAHHLGIPDMKLLSDICDKLDISFREHLIGADEITVDLDGEVYSVTLRLDQQKKQLMDYFPEERDHIETFMRYMEDFGSSLYQDEANEVRKYFLQLVNVPFEKLLRNYFSDQKLIRLLTFLGPCYGGVDQTDSAFTYASLISTYGRGAYYFDDYGEWLIQELTAYIRGREQSGIINGFQVQSIRFGEADGCYDVYDQRGNKICGSNIIFANYFVDILKEYCDHAAIADRKLEKIFQMEVGPSAYRMYFKIEKKLARNECVHIGAMEGEQIADHSFILSTMDNEECNVMLTVVADAKVLKKAEKEIAEESGRVVAEYFHIQEENVKSIAVCTPEGRQKTTLNKAGAVFGWKRNVKNNMTANLIYEISKSIKNVYVVGNWSATFGIFGTIYTVGKLYHQLGGKQ